MKNKYLHAISAALILERDYDPLKLETGVYIFGDLLKVMSRHSKGANFIIELLDGDALSREAVIDRLQADREFLAADHCGEITHLGELTHLIGVYVFDGKPDPEKIGLISNHENPRSRRRYLSYYTVNLTDRTVSRHFQSDAPNDGLEKILHQAFLAQEKLASIPDVYQLLNQRNREYRITLKTRKTTVTYTLLALNVAVWLLLQLLAAYFGVIYRDLLPLGAKINQSIALGEYWRLLTPIFLHADEIHLLVNCYSLYVLGQGVEQIYGPRKFAIIYFGAGIFGNIVSMIFTVPNSYGVGASGAIFGLLGAVLYYGIENPRVFKKYFGSNVIATIIINLVIASLIPNIDSFAHLGGMVGGFLVSGIVKVNAPPNQFPNRYMMLLVTLLMAMVGLYYGIRIANGVFGF